MAIRQQQHQNQSLFLDALFCEENQWEEEEQEGLEEEEEEENGKTQNPYLLFLPLEQQDLCWEELDEELLSLFSKEEIQNHLNSSVVTLARKEAVDWILKVNTHYGFTALTAILAINYLDRFLSSHHFQRDKPWMTQLAAVTCLSLAAKVEETQVPLLLDFQVEETRYVFEAKTIQRMELLVLSSLQWRMNPVTPLSFLDHIIRRFGLKTHVHWDFFRRCECLLLAAIADSRFVGFQPSVLATATMLHVIHQVETCKPIDYQNQLLGVLKISREKVNDCYQLIVGLSIQQNNPHKRKYEQINPDSPSGVIEASFGSDCSNDYWDVIGSSSVSSSPPQPLFKKSRSAQLDEQTCVLSLTRVFVNLVGTPR